MIRCGGRARVEDCVLRQRTKATAITSGRTRLLHCCWSHAAGKHMWLWCFFCFFCFACVKRACVCTSMCVHACFCVITQTCIYTLFIGCLSFIIHQKFFLKQTTESSARFTLHPSTLYVGVRMDASKAWLKSANAEPIKMKYVVCDVDGKVVAPAVSVTVEARRRYQAEVIDKQVSNCQ